MKTIKSAKVFTILCIISVILMFSVAVYADEYCDNIKETAAIVMKYRQEGSSYSSLYAVAVKNDAIYGGSLEQIHVRMAFTYPRLYDLEARKALIESFSNAVYNRCIQATSN